MKFRALLILIALLLGLSLQEREHGQCEVSNAEQVARVAQPEQLSCNYHHNIDIEQTSTVAVIPSVRTTNSNISRQSQLRMFHLMKVENIRITSNYPTLHFVHRLGNCARAVDFYLYMLCQLRL